MFVSIPGMTQGDMGTSIVHTLGPCVAQHLMEAFGEPTQRLKHVSTWVGMWHGERVWLTGDDKEEFRLRVSYSGSDQVFDRIYKEMAVDLLVDFKPRTAVFQL